MSETIRVEVAYAEAHQQLVRSVKIDATATVEQAIHASGILAELPLGFAPSGIGIFGRIVTPSTRLRAGDRIELYRPLQIDPKDARRLRAKKY